MNRSGREVGNGHKNTAKGNNLLPPEDNAQRGLADFNIGVMSAEISQGMKKQSKTDWVKIKALKDRDINFSDVPELDDDFFAGATLWPGKKKQITLRLDPDVVDFFKTKGRGYQSNINAALRRYMEAQERRLKST